MKKDPHLKREAAKYDNPIPSREFILEVMAEASTPMTFRRLVKVLGLGDPDRHEPLHRRLRAMVRDGQLVVNRNIYALADRMELVSGKIIGHPDGFGFVDVPGRDEDIFLGFRQMRSVFHGDIAQVRIRGRNNRGREEGEILEVVERNTSELVGRLVRSRGVWLLEPSNNRVTQEIIVTDVGTANEGDIAVVRIDDYPTYHEPATASVVEVLGDRLTPEIEVEIILRNHDIPSEFPGAVVTEAGDLPLSIRPADKRGRVRLEDLPLVTIDGEDAKDFDDAVYCEARPRGGWRLVVAIADVAHYVRPGSALDRETFKRGTSVYFPSYVVPMLPETISNGLCSLRPEVDRLALVCDMTLSARGNITSYQFCEAVIHSKARLTYTQVAAHLSGDDPGIKLRSDVKENLSSLFDLFKVLARVRKQRGALEIDTGEVMFDITDGRITGVRNRERNDAHRLIEECMLCANVCAARFIRESGKPGLYRVHEPPEDDKVAALADLLQTFGIRVSFDSPVQPQNLEAALSHLRERKNGRVLQLAVLRTLNQAVYQPGNLGHFGLSYREYSHFTSPIRRLPDLITHRLIKSVIHGKQENKHVVRAPQPLKRNRYDYEMEDVVVFGEQSSMTERRAEAASYDLLEWMKCCYMEEHEGDIRGGIITAVTRFGVFVELDEVFCEGLIHVSNLPGEYYHFETTTQTLVGDRSGVTFGLGDLVSVQIARVNPDERKVDLELVSHTPTRRGRSKGKPGRERKVKRDERGHRGRAAKGKKKGRRRR